MACVAIQMAVTHFAYAWIAYACVCLEQCLNTMRMHGSISGENIAGQDRQLSQPVGGPSVRSISDLRHESSRGIVQQLLHPFDGIFITHVQPQLLLRDPDMHLNQLNASTMHTQRCLAAGKSECQACI